MVHPALFGVGKLKPEKPEETSEPKAEPANI
jgi:hypothetical protein